jgi:hypothetical protein
MAEVLTIKFKKPAVATSENEPILEEESDSEDKRSEERKERTRGGIEDFDKQDKIEVDTTAVPDNVDTTFHLVDYR